MPHHRTSVRNGGEVVETDFPRRIEVRAATSSRAFEGTAVG
jgi:hypothetical protein